MSSWEYLIVYFSHVYIFSLMYLFSVLDNVLVYAHLLISELFPFLVFSNDGRGDSNDFPVRRKVNFQNLLEQGVCPNEFLKG